ncbi:MAG: glycosyltransferase [Candidatus Helarchaeota archaeon]
MPKVSVVIASYNHEKYVAEAIQSILDQTYQDFEIVITDDGSTDGTVAEIKKFTDPRIKLFCFENNRGACVAMRKCLDEAEGDYIAVLNSDDIFLSDKLEKQVRFLDEHKDVGAVFSYAQIIGEESNNFTDENHCYYNIFKQHNRSHFEWLHRFFYEGNCLCHPSVLIRNRCYKSIGYYDERYAQLPDFDFWTRLCMKYEIYIIPENLIKFRVRNDEANVSGQRTESMIRTSWEYAHILKNYLKINSVDILLKVFPEAAEYKDIDSDSIPFVLAMLAWKTGRKSHQEFALDVLAEQLSNREIAKRLAANFGFRYIDFIGLTGRCDLYGIENARSGLEAVRNELEAIHNSHGWKLIVRYYRFRDKIFPFGSRRRKYAKKLKAIVKRRTKIRTKH